jgi:hypothetical protein
MLNILLDQADVTKALMGTSEVNVLEAYVTEMLRINLPIQGIYREAKANEVVGSTSITAGAWSSSMSQQDDTTFSPFIHLARTFHPPLSYVPSASFVRSIHLVRTFIHLVCTFHPPRPYVLLTSFARSIHLVRRFR